MRAVWIDYGNDPDWGRMTSYQMTALFFHLLDPLRSSRISDAKARGYNTGVYVSDSWGGYDMADGVVFANAVNLKAPVGGKVQLDIEKHDAQFLINALSRWRVLRPNQDTSWTMEPFQAGWVTQELVDKLLALKIRVVPQYYRSAMQPVAADRVFKQWVDKGIPTANISGFYDAAALAEGWDGFAFTQGRLP